MTAKVLKSTDDLGQYLDTSMDFSKFANEYNDIVREDTNEKQEVAARLR